MIKQRIKILEKLLLVEELITQGVCCLLDYTYFIDYHRMIAVDLNRQQALDADCKAIQQINFAANLDRAGNTRIYFIFEEAKKTGLDFSQGTVKFF